MNIASPLPHKEARIEIIPLIDIMFFLLASFMMVSLSQVVMKGMPVQLPTGKSGKVQSKKDYLALSVDRDGYYYWDKKKVGTGGPGSGNDVSRALEWGADHVDAVEIDPVIQQLGERDNPDKPYQDPRVTVHLGRAKALHRPRWLRIPWSVPRSTRRRSHTPTASARSGPSTHRRPPARTRCR